MLKAGDIPGGIYEITENIGSGGGGIVFRANHLRMQKPVALKLIKDDVKGILENRAEVDILKNLKNDYLPQVLDFVEDNGDVYTVMEFIEGKDLKSLVMSGRQFDEKSVTKYALQLCSAVEYLHSQTPPIIHSDIKPANIMLTPEDKICLIDFNISSISDGSGAYSVGGSRGFAAPEQFRKVIDVPVTTDEFHEETRFISSDHTDDADDDATEILTYDDDETEIIGAENMTGTAGTASAASTGSGTSTAQTRNISKAYVDTRTDIYGIGASLYYIIASRLPVAGKLDFRGIKISGKLRKVIEKAMSQDPEDRYKSVSEMKKDLENNGTIKLNIKAVIASVIAAAVIVAGIIAYPIVNVAMHTKASVTIYGSEYVIEKTSKDELYGYDVSDKYNATAVSALKQAYEYIKKLPYPERTKYISPSSAVLDAIRRSIPDYQAAEPGSGSVKGGALLAENWLDDDLMSYVIKNYTNYTGKEELYFYLSTADEGMFMYISDDPNLVETMMNSGHPDTSKHIGAAVTAAVNEVELSEKEGKGFDIDEVVSTFKFLGRTHYADEAEFTVSASDLSSEDLSPMANFTALKKLTVEYCENTSLSAFPELPSVEELIFRSSDLTDIEGISDKFPGLRILNLESVPVTDISPVTELSGFEGLVMQYYSFETEVPDLSPLSEVKGLKILKTGGVSSVHDLSFLEGTTTLEELDIGYITFDDDSFLDIIFSNKDLRVLNMESVYWSDWQKLKSLEGFEQFTKLEELNINSSDVSDISPLKGMTGMKKLHIDIYGLRDISIIKDMTELEELELGVSYIFDASVFKDLTKMKSLGIRLQSGYADGAFTYPRIDTAGLLGYISEMKSLEELSLDHLIISDEEAEILCGMESLNKLTLYNADISAESAKKIEDAVNSRSTDERYTHVYVDINKFKTSDDPNDFITEDDAVNDIIDTDDDDDFFFDDSLEYPDDEEDDVPVDGEAYSPSTFDMFDLIAENIEKGRKLPGTVTYPEGAYSNTVELANISYEADLCDYLGQYIKDQTGWSAAILWRLDDNAGDIYEVAGEMEDFLERMFPDADESRRSCLIYYNDLFYVYLGDEILAAAANAEQSDYDSAGAAVRNAVGSAGTVSDVIYEYYYFLLIYAVLM